MDPFVATPEISELLRQLGFNAGLVSLLVIVFGLLVAGPSDPLAARPGAPERLKLGLLGLCFGVCSVLAMEAPLKLPNGLVVDAKTVISALGGAYLPWPGAVLALVLALAWRAHLGGIGMLAGMAAMAGAVALGWAWRRVREPVMARVGAIGWLAGLGLSIAALGLLLLLTLPDQVRWVLFAKLALPVGLVFPLTVVVFGIFFEGILKFRQQEHELRRALQRQLQAASVFSTSQDSIMIANPAMQFVDVNPAFTRITGYSRDEVLGRHVDMVSSSVHDAEFQRAIETSLQNTGSWSGEIWRKRKNGETYPEMLSIDTVYNEDGSVAHYVGIATDITERKRTEELIWQHANFDLLTGLPNRRMFHDRLEQEMRKANRSGNALALILIDLDRFKEVNDTLGHSIGDALLREAARRLLACVRDTDTVARIGGDEFTLILGELSNLTPVERVSAAVLEQLALPFQLEAEQAFISASLGITLYPSDGTEIGELIKNADQAMYVAKDQGRNRVTYFTPALQAGMLTRTRLIADLRHALAERQMRVAYQPIVHLASGRITKAEALLRWQHPELGLIRPAQFISLAEETGLITPIGDWVFQQVTQQVRHYRKHHDPNFQISVNRSPVQFHSESGHAGSWRAQLAAAGLPGSAIAVEITEGLLLDASERVEAQLAEFREHGVQISIDDFGTGYSSLSYLKKFSIDTLKIDQSFVRNLAPDSDDLALCEAIIVMAHRLGIQVVAEGVETTLQRDLLAAAGCDYAQGYLFSRPVAASDFVLMLD